MRRRSLATIGASPPAWRWCCRRRPAPRAQDSPLLAAMQDEMQRSMAELRMKGEPAPYYIEYEIDDLASMRAVARLGGVVDDLADRSRTLQVEVRVGDYAFDSSRFVTQDRGAGVVPVAVRPADLARRRLRRDPAADLADDRRGLQARGQRVREEEGDVPEPRGSRRRHSRFLAGDAGRDGAARPPLPAPSARRVGRSRRSSCRRCSRRARSSTARKCGSAKRTAPATT